jgi:hypothetical protein
VIGSSSVAGCDLAAHRWGRPADLATSCDGAFLYVPLPGTGGVGAFAVAADGRLARIASEAAMPTGSAALVAA